MACTLAGNLIGETFQGLIKTSENCAVTGPVLLTDGCGASTSLSIGTVNDGINVTGPVTAGTVNASGNVSATGQVIGSSISTTGFLHAATTAGNCVGIGTSTPNQKLTVNGSISANGSMYLDLSGLYTSNGFGLSGEILCTTGSKIEWTPPSTGGDCEGTVCGTGTVNYVSKFTPNGTTIGNSIIQDNGNIGIDEAPNASFKLKVNGTTCSTKFCGPITGNLTGNICGNTTVGGNLTVNCTTSLVGAVCTSSTLNVGGQATLASAKITGVLKDSNDGTGVSGQYLKSTASGTVWENLPGIPGGANCTGTVCTSPAGGGTVDRIAKFTPNGTTIGDSAIYQSSTNGRIGIGEAADATCRLTVNGGACIKGQMVSNNAFIFCNLTVEGNTVLGNNNGVDTTVSCGDFFVGGTDVANGRNVAIDAGTGNIDTKGTITATGIIYGRDDIIAFATSDERLKDNKKCITDANNIINGLNNYCFDWNDKSDREGTGIGVLAQDVQKVLPNAVCERDNGYLAVDYNQFIPVLLQRVKELSAEVEELKAKIN